MSKMMKSKKDKVPKLTEAEYAQYISALKNTDLSFQVDGNAEKALESSSEEKREGE